MYDQVIPVLVSAVVFIFFIPGFFFEFGGKKYAIFLHALIFALFHQFLSKFLSGMLPTFGTKRKGLYGEDGHGIQKKGLYGEDGHGIQQM